MLTTDFVSRLPFASLCGCLLLLSACTEAIPRPTWEQKAQTGYFSASATQSERRLLLQGAYNFNPQGEGRIVYFLPCGTVVGRCETHQDKLICSASNCLLTEQLSELSKLLYHSLAHDKQARTSASYAGPFSLTFISGEPF